METKGKVCKDELQNDYDIYKMQFNSTFQTFLRNIILH